MSLRVSLSPLAANEVYEIVAYLALHSLAAAERFLEDLEHAQRQLAAFPNSGPPGLIPGTRRLVLGNYIISYRIKGQAVEIFAVRHARRNDARS